ncbi:MAG: ABC transporter permease [Candidatus Didemnitutus sp.]|nr:ABC transporter permease [Candidatus Didemnitutus sp.]
MLSDLRLAARTLARSPLFTLVAVFTLTLGIGVNTAMFGIVNAVVLRGLPFPEQHRVLHVENNNLKAGIDSMGMSSDDFRDLRAGQSSFEDLAAYQERTFNISSEGADPERVTGCAITFSGPAMLRVPVLHGRWFLPTEGEPSAAPVVVLGHSLWRDRFKSDPSILGRSVKVNGEWATVVGVAPADFRFPEESDAWMPLRQMPDEKRDNRYWEVMGRLKDGVSLEAARAEIAGLARQLETAHADTNRDVGVTVKPLRDEFIDDETRQLMGLMFGAVFLVMLIACANVANLLLARAAVRGKEIAVRSALGSGRRRLVQLLLSEALLLSSAGAALGLGVAYGLMAIFNHYVEGTSPPYWMVFDIDATGIAYVVGLALFSCLAAGLWPAWRASRSDLVTVLKDGGRGSTGFSLSKFTRAMVVGEVVLSCVLLVLSGLYVRSVMAIQSTDIGYRTAGIFTNRIGLPEAEFKTADAQREFYRQLVERLAARPEIESAAISSAQPTWNNRNVIVIDGRPAGPDAPRQFATEVGVSGGYFDTLGIKLLQGRTFDDRDTASALPVAIVSSRFVEKYWPGENPLGQRFAYGDGSKPAELKWLTVIGVVSPTLQGNFQGEWSNMPQAYVPFSQRNEARFMTVFTRARTGDAAALAPVVRTTVRALNDDLPIYWPRTLEAMVAQAKFFKQLFAWIFGIFGGVALVLSGVGLYGVMAYSVNQRTQEIGVRMALGAAPGAVLRLILREGGLRLALGLAIGLGLGFLAGKLQTNFLYGVTPTDPATFLGVALTLGTAGLLACLVPALRAVRVNPVEALRSE